MKKVVILLFVGVLFLGCSNRQKEKNAENTEKEAVVYSIDDLYTKAGDLEGQEVVVKGTVMHVCKQGGGRCFLMGSTEDVNIRVEAGEKIGAFSQEQMGSELEIVGILKEVKTAADAHNPSAEHGEEADHEEDEQTEEAHRVIAEAQEAAEIVYFIEGMEIK